MKKNYSTTLHLPMISVATEAVIAKPYQFIIDWQDFHIVALWVKLGLTHKKVVLWQDVQEISNGWYIQSEEAFSEPDDLVRLEKIFAEDFDIKGALCKTFDGGTLGKVSDFTFDVATGQITQIMIKNHLLKPVAHELVLPIQMVKQVKDETLFIDDLDKQVPVSAANPMILPVTNYV